MSWQSCFDCCKDKKMPIQRRESNDDVESAQPKELEIKRESIEVVVKKNDEKEEDVVTHVVQDEKVINFHLVRHGETNYNKKGRVQGHMDISLNENGFNQAKSLGLCLSKVLKKANAVIASPVLRAKQTGQEIYAQMKNKRMKFTEMAEFAELHYGNLVDHQIKDVNDIVVDIKEVKWANGNLDASFPGDEGESFNDIIGRMKNGFTILGNEYRNGANIIIATHSQCIEAFLVYLKAFGYLDKKIRSKNKNCTISKIEYHVHEKKFVVQSVFEDLTEEVAKIETLNLG